MSIKITLGPVVGWVGRGDIQTHCVLIEDAISGQIFKLLSMLDSSADKSEFASVGTARERKLAKMIAPYERGRLRKLVMISGKKNGTILGFDSHDAAQEFADKWA